MQRKKVISTEYLEYFLRRVEYKPLNIHMTAQEMADPNYVKMEKNNMVLGRSFHDTFQKWHKEFKRIPTPQEFIARQMTDIRKNFECPEWRRNKHINFELNAVVEKGIKQRLERSYISCINEIHTACIISREFPHLTIERAKDLDYSGVDILAIDRKNRIEHKIHITKNSPYAIDFLFKKEDKELTFKNEGKCWNTPKWKHLNHRVYSKRDFKGHMFLLYSAHNDDRTKIVNGYPLFRDEFIINKIKVNTMLGIGAY